MRFCTELLHKTHQSQYFFCGDKQWDFYLKKQALEDMAQAQEACFVSLENHTKLVSGFYTLSNISLPLTAIPKNHQRKLPKSFKSIPVTLLSRLTVEENCIDEDLRQLLLIDALKRSYEASKTIGSFAVVVNPKDYNEEKFYTDYGFKKLPTSQKLFLVMATIRRLF